MSDIIRIPRKYVPAIAPCMDRLVIQICIRLGQEGKKAVLDTQFDRRGTGILRAAGTPQVQRDTLPMEFTNPRHDRRHGDALGAKRANQGVIDIHEYDALLHVFSQENRFQIGRHSRTEMMPKDGTYSFCLHADVVPFPFSRRCSKCEYAAFPNQTAPFIGIHLLDFVHF
jgi:hypothetical protein